MKTFTTHLYAINPDTQDLQRFAGPHILAESWDEAELYCYTQGLEYLVVDGQVPTECRESDLVKAERNFALN